MHAPHARGEAAELASQLGQLPRCFFTTREGGCRGIQLTPLCLACGLGGLALLTPPPLSSSPSMEGPSLPLLRPHAALPPPSPESLARYKGVDLVPTYVHPPYNGYDPEDTYSAFNKPGSVYHWLQVLWWPQAKGGRLQGCSADPTLSPAGGWACPPHAAASLLFPLTPARRHCGRGVGHLHRR